MKEAIGFPFAAPALTTALEPRRHYVMVGGGGAASLLLMTDEIRHPFSFQSQAVSYTLAHNAIRLWTCIVTRNKQNAAFSRVKR